MSEHVCACVLVLTVQQSSLATCFTESGGLPDGFGTAATHQKVDRMLQCLSMGDISVIDDNVTQLV